MARRVEVRAQGIAGDETNAFVSKFLVSVGQSVEREAALCTIDTSKSVLEVFAPESGRVTELSVAPNTTVQEGDVLVVIECAEPEPVANQAQKAEPAPASAVVGDFHASPWIRGLARERGLDLARIHGTGRHGRILETDLTAPAPVAPSALVERTPAQPARPLDASLPSDVLEVRPLSALQLAGARTLGKSWKDVPHVTQFDEVDITELEPFRVALNQERQGEAPKFSLLPFIVKASACALLAFPEFNGSLVDEQLIIKRSVNIGFAVDTGDGLRVPVIQNADRLNLRQIAAELARLSERARTAQLSSSEARGGTFTISNLGGVGGTAFTPIINVPELAILGVSKSEFKPKWNGSAFVPRLMLPLSLSYDHRVINGVAGARFATYLGSLLSDLRRALL